jgi:hypothetical protein
MLALAVCAAGATTNGFAQERRLPPAVMGFYGAYDYGHIIPLKTSADIIGDPYANKAESSTVGVTFIFPKIVAEGFGLSTSVSYGHYFFEAGRTADETIRDQFGNDVLATTYHNYVFNSQAAQMDLMIYAHVGDIARFEIGPWVGLGFLPTYTERVEILSPAGTTFSDLLPAHEQTVTASNSVVFNYGGMVRGSLEIPIFGGMSLLPFAQLRVAGLMSNQGNDAGVSGMFGGGLGILFGQTNGTVIDAPPTSALDTAAAPPPAPEAAPEASLGAKVDLYSRDAAGRHRDTLLLMAHRTLHRMEVPLTPEFHFERNSAALPARYAGYTAATHADFTLDAYAGKSPADLHRQALNVIGMRLAASPAGSITITGNASADEPKWFAGARADEVAQYLMRTWGVRKEQIKLGGASPRGGRSQSVTIASATPGILDPIATEWIEQEVNPAPIGLEPEIVAPKGVKEWHASVRQGNREIGIVRNTDSVASGIMSASGLMAAVAADGSVPALSAELVVQDSAGAMVVARDNLAVVIEGNLEDGDAAVEHSVSRYFLMGTRDGQTDRSIQRIVDAIGDSATISLRPMLPEGASRAGAQERLGFVAERLRRACAEKGKDRVAIAAREAIATNAADNNPAADDPFASPIEVTVVN